MISKKIALNLLSGWLVLIAAVYLLNFSELTNNILFLTAPLLAVLAGLYAINTYRLSNGRGQVMGLMTAGLACWLIGETLFFMFQFVWHIDPYPSVADIFYLLGYPLIFAGLTKEMLIHKVELHNFNKLYFTLVVLILVGLAVIVSYFGVVLAYDSAEPFMSNAISIAYGINDLILIVPGLFILKIALDYKGGKLYNTWILILVAMLCMLGGDILFAIFKKQYEDLLWPYTLIDIGYVSCYLLFTYSFFYTASTIRELHAKLIK